MTLVALRAAACAAALFASAGPAWAQADFYKGKTIVYIVATAPGGGYDTYARLIAKHMERHLPETRIVVSNVPGAGHIVGANQLYAARPDGLTIGTFNTGLIYGQILRREGVRFDLRRFSWIGKAASDARVLVVGKDAPIAGPRDLIEAKEPIKVAVAGVGSASYNDLLLLAAALEFKTRLIPGHNGTEGELAVMRGEVAATFGAEASLRTFVKNGFGRYAVAVGSDTAGVPDARAFVKNDTGREILALIESQALIGRLTAAPPGVPADRLETLRAAYRKALEDPALLAEAAKLDQPIEPKYGDEVAKLIDGAMNQSPASVALIAGIMNVKVDTVTVRSALLEVEGGGRSVVFKSGDETIKAQPSGSRTKIKIAGKDAKRDDLKAGMTCIVEFKPGPENEPQSMECAP